MNVKADIHLTQVSAEFQCPVCKRFHVYPKDPESYGCHTCGTTFDAKTGEVV